MGNQFYVNKYTDMDLKALYNACVLEMGRREEARKRRRQEWIDVYANEAYHYANYELVGETVVVAVVRNGSIHMGKATPIKGDVFDVDTGVAVAYAKAKGIRIPSFI